MKGKKSRFNSGESLVEVMVGIFIFLIILAGLQSAISFCSNAQRKTEEIRRKNAEISRSLHNATYTPGTEKKVLEFKATVSNPNGGIMDTPPPDRPLLFKIKVDLGTMDAEYEDEGGGTETVRFYLFGDP